MRTPIAIMTADIHARNTVPRCRKDDFVAAQRRKLEYIRSNIPEGCVWLDAGDLFHTWRSQPETEIMLLEILYGIKFVSIPGNHEIPYHNISRLDSSSFSVLYAAGTIEQCDPPSVPCAVPDGFYSGMELKLAGLKIAIMHGMVWPDVKPIPEAEGATAKEILQRFPQYDIILTGHNHETFVVEDGKRKLVNPGSLMRSAWDQRGHRPCYFVLYDNASVEQIFIPVEADVFAESLYQREADRDERMQAFLERVGDTENFSLSYLDNVRLYCQQNKVPVPVRQEIEIAIGEGV